MLTRLSLTNFKSYRQAALPLAALTFLIAGAISWPHTLVALATATIGGMVGAAIAKRMPAIWLRRFVIAVGAVLTVIYFVKTY